MVGIVSIQMGGLWIDRVELSILDCIISESNSFSQLGNSVRELLGTLVSPATPTLPRCEWALGHRQWWKLLSAKPLQFNLCSAAEYSLGSSMWRLKIEQAYWEMKYVKHFWGCMREKGALYQITIISWFLPMLLILHQTCTEDTASGGRTNNKVR